MTTCRSSPVGGVLVSPRLCVSVVKRANNLKIQQGWEKGLSWRLEPEVQWHLHRSRKQRQASRLHLFVAASTKETQNVDLPPVLPKRKKKPFLVPHKTRRKIKRNSRSSFKLEEPILRAPANGLLVKTMIPVAHDVMEAKAILTTGVEILMKTLPVFACRYCSQVHVGNVGHNLRTCQGPSSDRRGSIHGWLKGNIDDILVPIEAYHLADRLALPVSHDDRFIVERILAIDELCIQAGVDVPEYPTKRYTEAIEPRTRKTREDASWRPEDFTYYTATGSYQIAKEKKPHHLTQIVNEDAADNQVETPRGDTETIEDQDGEIDPLHDPIVGSFRREEIIPLDGISSEDDRQTVARKTLKAWERLRAGAKRLMKNYRVLACGYCPEIHVGPRGHRARVCGAFKHQWRDGKHGWQDASLDELVPPQFVWHVRDRDGPPLDNALRKFYGQAPALVELCVQAGASVPEDCKPMMRLDIAIPTLDECENVV